MSKNGAGNRLRYLRIVPVQEDQSERHDDDAEKNHDSSACGVGNCLKILIFKMWAGFILQNFYLSNPVVPVPNVHRNLDGSFV